jgi:hypothetical protein
MNDWKSIVVHISAFAILQKSSVYEIACALAPLTLDHSPVTILYRYHPHFQVSNTLPVDSIRSRYPLTKEVTATHRHPCGLSRIVLLNEANVGCIGIVGGEVVSVVN